MPPMHYSRGVWGRSSCAPSICPDAGKSSWYLVPRLVVTNLPHVDMHPDPCDSQQNFLDLWPVITFTKVYDLIDWEVQVERSGIIFSSAADTTREIFLALRFVQTAHTFLRQSAWLIPLWDIITTMKCSEIMVLSIKNCIWIWTGWKIANK